MNVNINLPDDLYKKAAEIAAAENTSIDRISHLRSRNNSPHWNA